MFLVDFSGVGESEHCTQKACAVSLNPEMIGPPPLRRFVFSNWGHESDSHLEVDAVGFTVAEE